MEASEKPTSSKASQKGHSPTDYTLQRERANTRHKRLNLATNVGVT